MEKEIFNLENSKNHVKLEYKTTGGKMNPKEKIEVNPKIMLGKPVIKGTRITVELILKKLSEGISKNDLLDAYPNIKEDDIQAALAYAAESLSFEETVTL